MITKLSAFKHLLERSLQDKKFKYKVITYTITAVHIFLVGAFQLSSCLSAYFIQHRKRYYIYAMYQHYQIWTWKRANQDFLHYLCGNYYSLFYHGNLHRMAFRICPVHHRPDSVWLLYVRDLNR